MPQTSPPISEEVVLAVSDAEGTPPTDLPALNDSIDIDALDDLLDSRPAPAAPDSAPDSDFVVRFTYSNSLITIRGDGSINVAPGASVSRY